MAKTVGSRQPQLKPSNGIWIKESCSFPGNVVVDTLQELRDDRAGLALSEIRSLGVLKKIWMKKLLTRQPNSNCRPPTPKKPRRRTTISVQRQLNPIAPPTEDRVECDVFELEDDEIVKNRICIPRLLSRWRLRYFEIVMPAYVIKRGLLNRHFNWELMHQVMDATDDEGTAILQQFVDDVVKNLSP
ncbi:moonshiner [Drosophila rhopaloa]|uniref:Uncharacterized protein LOC108039017 n=1 Tax=Drosophila rhopaloa TaxID=1041015 RepID=A0A6P4E0N4_DRORH|nr:moonshiner [Drosophila rhopaloa]